MMQFLRCIIVIPNRVKARGIYVMGYLKKDATNWPKHTKLHPLKF